MTDYFPTIVVKAAFGANPGAITPTFTDITSYVTGFSIRSGRTKELDKFQAATCSIMLDNSSGNFYPNDAASAFYPNIVPGVRIRIEATLVGGGGTFPLYDGFVETWPPDWPNDFEESATVTCVDGFKALNLNQISTTRGVETTLARATAICTIVGIGCNTFGIGTNAAAQVIATSALDHLQDMETTENGQCYMYSNSCIFESRHYRSANYGAVSWTFNDDADAAGGFGILYQDLTPSFDDQNLWTQVIVTADRAGVPQVSTVEDIAASAKYWRRTLTRTIGVDSGPEADDAANWLLNKYHAPLPRYDTITIDPRFPDGTPGGYQMACSAKFGQLCRVVRHPRHGTTIDTNVRIEAINHDVSGLGSKQSWVTTLSLSPDIGYREWILEDASNGLLEVSTILSY